MTTPKPPTITPKPPTVLEVLERFSRRGYGRMYADEVAHVYIAVKALVEAARGVRAWGVEFDDERIGYITVQVGRADVEELDAALRPFLPTEEAGDGA